MFLMEEKRTPVGRPDFKSGERRETSLVGPTPTLFRHFNQCALRRCFSRRLRKTRYHAQLAAGFFLYCQIIRR